MESAQYPPSNLRRSSREGYTGNLLKIVNKGDFIPASEESGDRFALSLAYLHRQKTRGLQCGSGLRDEAAVNIEPFRPGEERGGRFVLAHFGVEGREIDGGNVGWIGDDRIESRFDVVRRGQCIEEIGLDEADAVGNFVSLSIDSSYGEGFRRDV